MPGPPLPSRPVQQAPASSLSSSSGPPPHLTTAQPPPRPPPPSDRVSTPLSLPRRPPALGQVPGPGTATPPAPASPLQRSFTPTPAHEMLSRVGGPGALPLAASSRPSTYYQSDLGSTSAGASPRSGMGSAASPAPARPPLAHQGDSSASLNAHPSTSTSAPPLPDNSHPDASPWSAIRPRLEAHQVAPTAQPIELGEGWSVRYRAWKAPATLVLPSSSVGGSRAPEDGAELRTKRPRTRRMDYDPWRAPLGSVSPFVGPGAAPAAGPAAAFAKQNRATAKPDVVVSGPDAGPAAKKAKRASSAAAAGGNTAAGSKAGAGNAFDDLLANELTTSTSSAGSALALPALAPLTPDPAAALFGAETAKTPPIPGGGAAPAPGTQGGASAKPLRLPAAVRKARAQEEAVAAGTNATTTGTASPAAPPRSANPASASLQSSTASAATESSGTSESRPRSDLRERFEPLSDPHFLAEDPLHVALRDLHRRREELVRGGKDRLDLVWHVQRHPVAVGSGISAEPDDKPSQGNDAAASSSSPEGEEDSPAGEGDAQLLWVFSVVKGGERDPDDDVEMVSPEHILSGFHFEGLEDLAEGVFSHSTLFPRLYASDQAASASQFVSPLSTSARAYPSALALSEKIVTVPSAADPTPAMLAEQGAYRNFRSAIAACIVDELAARPPTGRLSVCFDSAVAFVADPAQVLPGLAPPPTFRAEVHPPALQRTTLLVLTTMAEVALTPLSDGDLVRPGSNDPARVPAVLAPVEVPAHVVKTIPTDASPDRFYAEWADALERAGVDSERARGEGFVLCALECAGSGDTEVVWPRALVLVNRTKPGRKARDAGGRPSHHAAAASAAPGGQAVAKDESVATSTSPASQPEQSTSAQDAAAGPSSPGDVWAWYREESRRRADAKAEAQRREQAERDAARQKEQDADATADKTHAAPPGPPNAAAPINERTPMSLGTASTEAPSPAELVGPPAAPPKASAPQETDLARSTESRPDRDTANGMDIDFGLGFYPSPAEPNHTVLHGSSMPSSAPMSSIDAALSSFDWGDGTFGAGPASSSSYSHAPVPAQNRYEDSLLLGITDDDFSFFDAPVPSMHALDSSVAPEQAAPSIRQATNFEPFASSSAASHPENPFGFDMQPFSLGGAEGVSQDSTHAPAAFQSSQTEAAPVSALSTAESAETASASLPSAVVPPLFLGTAIPTPPSPPVVDFSPALRHPSATSPASRAYQAVPFETVLFDTRLASIDEKYDPRRGKYGLPSPDSDTSGKVMELLPILPREKRRTRSWYEAVYDPRVHVADSLASKRGKSAGGRVSDARWRRDGAGSTRLWERRRSADASSHNPRYSIDEGSLTTPGAWHDDDRVDDDEVESDGAGELSDAASSDGSAERTSSFETVTHSSASEVSKLSEALNGAALADCGNALQRVLSCGRSSGTGFAARTTAYEMVYATFAEQAVYQRQLRKLLLSRADVRSATAAFATASPISQVTSLVASVCGDLGVSPLFSDQTALPGVARESTPAFTLRMQDCIVRAEPLAFDFWRAMGFEPLATTKDVAAVVLLEEADPEGASDRAARRWLSAAGVTYEANRLGKHRPAELARTLQHAGVEGGLLHLPPGKLSGHATEADMKLVYSAIFELSKTNHNVVVYVHARLGVNLESLAAFADLLQQIAKCRAGVSTLPRSVVAIPVPLALPAAPFRASNSAHASIVFSVYDQLQVTIERLRLPVPETFPTARPPPIAPLGPAVRTFQAPAISVALSRTRDPRFALSWPPSSYDVEDRHRLLHICYTTRPVPGIPGHEWLVISVVDEKGETWRVLPRYLKYSGNIVIDVHRARIIWNFAKSIVDSTDVEWRILVCKLGEPSEVEIKAWESVLFEFAASAKRPLHLSFACADPSAALALCHAQPVSTRPSTTSSIPEEGEFRLVRQAALPTDTKLAVFDSESSFFSFTPSEPVPLPSLSVIAPATTYLVHVPRTTTLSHSASSHPLTLDSPPVRDATSTCAIHLLFSTASKTSLYDEPVETYLDDVRRSFVELAALGKARWGTSGRMSWPLEAVRDAMILADCIDS